MSTRSLCRLWIAILTSVCALAVFLLSAPAGHSGTVSAQSGDRMLTVSIPAATVVRAPRLKSPPVIPAGEKARLQAMQAQLHRRGPSTRVNPSAAMRAAPASLAMTAPRAAATLAKPRTGRSANAPGTAPLQNSSLYTLTLFQNKDLYNVVSDTTSVVTEPSVGNIGSAVLETGNWFAAVSTNGGNTFGYIDPKVFESLYGSLYGGFCCDQSVLYDPSRNLMLWTLMYQGDPATGDNIIGLAVLNGQASLEATPIVFHFYGNPDPLKSFSPQAIGFPAGYWFDYPQMALGNNYLYITANVFKPAFPSGSFARTVVLRVPLDELAAGSSLDYNSYPTNEFNATLVRGATDTMYWAAQVDTSTMRVYKWPEGGPVSSADVTHTSYPDPSNPANYTCPIGGVQDWCGRLDDRVQTGWLSGGVLGFVWNAPKGTAGFGTFSYPYVQFLFVNSWTLAFAGQSTMSSSSYAYAYPSVGLNAWGHVAGTVFYGGGTTAPTLAAFIWDNKSSTPYPQIPASWDVHDIAASSQGPTESKCSGCWGDYLSASMDHTSVFSRFLWVATGFTLQGGGLESDVHPVYLRFGRPENDPALVELNNKPLYFPLMSKSQ